MKAQKQPLKADHFNFFCMIFTTRKHTHHSHPHRADKKKKGTLVGNILRFGIALWLIGAISLWVVLAINLRGIPSITTLIDNPLSESTIIYDKNGNELYKLFRDGKRTYIPYEEISPDIIDAIVSAEDKTFFTNPGIDLKWLIRAWLNYITGKTDRIQGTSTISQQLISYTILSKERSLKRKIQEAVLSYELNSKFSKEKILELYLNVISFWNNAFWVEEASRVYFWKSAKDVWPLGASILASLPKWPTYFSPYSHRDRLMGYTYVYPIDTPENTINLESAENKALYQSVYTVFKEYVKNLNITGQENEVTICNVNRAYQKSSDYYPDSQWCLTLSYDNLINFWGNIMIPGTASTGSGELENIALEYYAWGRKDFVATRMFEDGKITGTEYRDIFFNGLEFPFQKYAEKIRYPYFVFYIKEYLEETYGKDIDITNGLRVYTTIDPKMQDKAEEILREQVKTNKSTFWASSAALVSMDNKTGHLLAMVGGPDYFDEANGGNNNMVTARRQPGSSFKSFVYALAISKWPIWPKSPIADVKTSFGKWTPDNYDRSFKGIMALENALDYSRNIPAIKMLFLAWGEEAVVDFGQSIWLSSLKDNAWYWAPIAIGTAEVKPIEMLQGYSVLANNGKKKKLTSILKIEDSERNILEEWKDEEWEEVFSPGASYIVSRILSDNSARPASDFWRNALSLKGGRVAAAKTGTSNKDVSVWREKKILPRDLWTIGYTPQITTVVWAGNVDGKETKWSCDGLNCAAPIWKKFMDFAHEWKEKLDFTRPKEWLYTVNISKFSGKLASEKTPESEVISTLMAVKPTQYDAGSKSIQIDTLCNGPISENTPEEAIANIFIPNDKPIIDGYDPKWTEWFFAAAKRWYVSEKDAAFSDSPCDRPGGPGNISLSLRSVENPDGTATAGRELVEAWWIGDRKITSLRILQNGTVKYETSYGSGGKENGTQRAVINIDGTNDTTFEVEVVDGYGYKYRESRTLSVKDSTVAKPTIIMKNPPDGDASKSLYRWDVFNLRFTISVPTSEREIVVLLDGKNIHTAASWDIFVIPVSSTDLVEWEHTIKIRITDGNFNQAERSISLTILPK